MCPAARFSCASANYPDRSVKSMGGVAAVILAALPLTAKSTALGPNIVRSLHLSVYSGCAVRAAAGAVAVRAASMRTASTLSPVLAASLGASRPAVPSPPKAFAYPAPASRGLCARYPKYPTCPPWQERTVFPRVFFQDGVTTSRSGRSRPRRATSAPRGRDRRAQPGRVRLPGLSREQAAEIAAMLDLIRARPETWDAPFTRPPGARQPGMRGGQGTGGNGRIPRASRFRRMSVGPAAAIRCTRQPGGCHPMYSSARRLSSHLPPTRRNASW